MLSEGRIEYPVTVRDKNGGFTTKTIIKEGPTNLVFTTTKTRVHAENETRILSLSTDDSRTQTARVLSELAAESNSGGNLKPWHDLQRWLTTADREVTIPYAKQLAAMVPPVAVRLRRDFGALLALIRAHAVLHQANRDRDDTGRIIATLDDYAVVRELVADVIAEGVGQTVSEPVRETVAAVGALASAEGVMALAIAAKLRLDKSTVSRRLRVAADGGYIRNLEDKRGKPGRWITRFMIRRCARRWWLRSVTKLVRAGLRRTGKKAAKRTLKSHCRLGRSTGVSGGVTREGSWAVIAKGPSIC